MASSVIDTYAEEEFISDTFSCIKKHCRTLSSVKMKWYIHRILPKDSILVECDNRARLELEIDISQWFSSREKLEQLIWLEMALISDELDPHFEYSHEYVKSNYGSDSPRQRFYPLIKTIWNIYNVNKLSRKNLPCPSVDTIKNQFHQCFSNSPHLEMHFNELIKDSKVYTFSELEKIAQKMNRLKLTANTAFQK